MASAEHEGIAQLFRERPELALELLANVGGPSAVPWIASQIEDATLPQSAPAHRPDLVASYFDARGRRVLAVIVEVQRGVDYDKGWTWPLYWAAIRARLRCRVVLLVLATNERVARWAKHAVSTGGPNVRFEPIVVGPHDVPRVTTREEAVRSPELAVLSAVVHGNEPGGAEVAMAAIEAIEASANLDGPTTTLYHDLVRYALDDAARKALEALMNYIGPKGYEYKSDFARKYYGEGHTDGEAKGLAAGRAEGVAAGRAEGVAAGRAEALLVLVRARGLSATPDEVARIRACDDSETLDRWLERLATAGSVAEALR